MTSPTEAVKQATAYGRFLSQPNTWVRIAKFIIGGGMVLAATYVIMIGVSAPKVEKLVGVSGKAKAVKNAAGSIES
jgi:hypothetical protein